MTVTLHIGDIPADLDFGDSVAIDTESMGLNPLRDRLCLIQLSSGDGNAHLVQFKNDDYSAPNLKKLLENENVTKIFHFARADVATIFYHLNLIVYPLYCTKIASRIARTYTDSHGLKSVCQALTGVDLSKQQQTSDWGADTLTPEQLEYAASDVLYLHKIRDELNKILVREDRLDLAESCFDFIPTRAVLDVYGWDEMDIFAH